MDKVVHFEIPADDTARAKNFYQTAFGWQIQSMPEFDYHILRTVEIDGKQMPKERGAINGGMLKRQNPVKNPVITINVENMDKACAKIKKAGGKIIREKMPVGKMGFAAYFEDTEGNVLGIWQERKSEE